MKYSLRNLTTITLFQEEELKDERVISVIVGVPASVEISVDKDLTELKVDETVTVECITVSEGNPPVSVNLYHEQKGEESQHLGDGSMVEYSPTLGDTGSGNYILEIIINLLGMNYNFSLYLLLGTNWSKWRDSI